MSAAARRVLIAGIGNVFLGDDGFGVEVAGQLDPATLPDGVDVGDYGIRGVHLAYELLDDGYDTLVMVDAIPMGEPPGTLAVLEVDLTTDAAEPEPADPFDAPAVDAHGMHPQAVLDLLRSMGGRIDRALIVGCEPAVIDEGMQLSAPVRAAVAEAVRLVTALAHDEVAPRAMTDAVPARVG